MDSIPSVSQTRDNSTLVGPPLGQSQNHCTRAPHGMEGQSQGSSTLVGPPNTPGRSHLQTNQPLGPPLTKELLDQHNGINPPSYHNIGDHRNGTDLHVQPDGSSIGKQPPPDKNSQHQDLTLSFPVNILHQDHFRQPILPHSSTRNLINLISINILGPYTETTEGHRHVLALTDCTTGDAEAYPLASISPRDIADLIVNDYVTRYGIIRNLYTDQGSSFDQELIMEMIQILRTANTGPSVYNYEGRVDGHSNHKLIDMIHNTVEEYPYTWDGALPYTLHSYRTSLSQLKVTQPCQASQQEPQPAPVTNVPLTPSAPSKGYLRSPPQSSTPHPNAPRRQELEISPVQKEPRKQVHFDSPSLLNDTSSDGLYHTAPSPSQDVYHTAPSQTQITSAIPPNNRPALPQGHNTSLGSMSRNDLNALSMPGVFQLQNQLQNQMQQQQLTWHKEQWGDFKSLLEKQHSNDNYRMKPDAFTGENWEWNDYQAHFEEVARCNGWGDKKKAAVLASSIKGTAIQAWRDKYPNTSASLSYDLLVLTMRDRFNPAGMAEAHKSQFQAARKKPDQSLMEYAYSLRRMAMKAYPSHECNAREEIVKDHFLRTLEDRNMRTAVTMAHPVTLELAISLATEYETLNDSEKQAPRKPVAPVLNPLPDPSPSYGGSGNSGYLDGDQLKLIADEVAKNLRQRRPYPNNPGNPRVCWTCQQPGHMQRSCPQRTSNPPVAPYPRTGTTTPGTTVPGGGVPLILMSSSTTFNPLN